MHRERDQEIRRRRKRREKALKRRIKELKAEAKVRNPQLRNFSSPSVPYRKTPGL